MAKGNRICSRCGKTYYRSNRMRVWTGQNPGHRTGWQREDVKLCCKCFGENAAGQVHKLVTARLVTIAMPKAKAS